MASNQEHPFHLVALSHWPIATAFSLLALTLGMVMFMHDYAAGKFVLGFGVISVAYCSWNWWSDVIEEGRSGKHHTEPVRTGLRIGMSLFILSEIMFFFAFFFSSSFSCSQMIETCPSGLILEGIPKKKIKQME
jgi:cytochrome c oxidase subunit 3